MLSRASTTSSAVENCWRTPPIARDVEPPTSSPRSATTTSSAPSSARWYATLAPIAPEPATTMRAIRARCARPRRARRRSGRAAARGRRRARARRAAPSASLRRGVERERLQRRAQRADARARSRASDRARARRRRRGSSPARPETAPVAPLREALRDQRLGPDEDVEPFDQVRLEPLPRRVGHLQSGEVRRFVAQSARARRAARRSRCAPRTRRRRTASERTPAPPPRSARELVGVEREIRRRDHGDGVGARTSRRALRARPCRRSSARRSGRRPGAGRGPRR